MRRQPLVPLSARIPAELRDRVVDAANRSGQDVSEFVRMALDEVTRERARPPVTLSDDVIQRLTQALLFTEASFEAFLAQREGLTDELQEKAKRLTTELLTGPASIQ